MSPALTERRWQRVIWPGFVTAICPTDGKVKPSSFTTNNLLTTSSLPSLNKTYEFAWPQSVYTQVSGLHSIDGWHWFLKIAIFISSSTVLTCLVSLINQSINRAILTILCKLYTLHICRLHLHIGHNVQFVVHEKRVKSVCAFDRFFVSTDYEPTTKSATDDSARPNLQLPSSRNIHVKLYCLIAQTVPSHYMIV